MCYAIPGEVIGLSAKNTLVNYFGETKKIINEFTNIKVGDFVYAQGGYLINKIPKKEAKEILKFWEKNFQVLRKLDQNFALIGLVKPSERLIPILSKIEKGGKINSIEALKILRTKKQADLEVIFKTANKIRYEKHGNAACVHGIIEFSNHCRNNCKYCGIRSDAEIERYRLTPQEIIDLAKTANSKYGFKALVLQSGEDLWYDEAKLLTVVKALRKAKILTFLSIGNRPLALYQKLYQAGARGILMRFETANSCLFAKYKPGVNFFDRVKLIKKLKRLGYLIATGYLAGLPGESNQDLAANLELTRSLKSTMYSFGPLIPTQGTPFERFSAPPKELLLKLIALTRFFDPDANILVTTALETLNKEAKKEALLAGANSLMINVTPMALRQKYNIYQNRAQNDLSIKENIAATIKLLQSIGRAPTDLSTNK